MFTLLLDGTTLNEKNSEEAVRILAGPRDGMQHRPICGWLPHRPGTRRGSHPFMQGDAVLLALG